MIWIPRGSQAQYIKDHPGSKQAQQAGDDGGEPSILMIWMIEIFQFLNKDEPDSGGKEVYKTL